MIRRTIQHDCFALDASNSGEIANVRAARLC